MRPIKFIHAGGLRLDSPYTGLRQPSAAVDERLRSATFDAFRNLQSLCETEAPDFLLIAGDIFELPDRSARAQLAFREGLAAIAASGVQVYLAFGPGDPAAAWLPTIDWPEGVHVLGGQPAWQTVIKDNETIALLQGVSQQSSSLPPAASSDFHAPTDNEVFTISLANQIPAQDDQQQDSRASLPPVHYWALGPTQKGSLASDPSRRMLTSGPTQGLSPFETGPFGCFVVRTDEAGRAGPRFVALDTVRWESVRVDVSDLDRDGALDAARDSVMKTLADSDGRDLICGVILTGSQPAWPIDIDRLLDDLRETVLFERPWSWVDRVENLTETAVNDPKSPAHPDDSGDSGDSGELDPDAAPLLAELNARYNSLIHNGALDELIRLATPEDYDPEGDRERVLIARDALALATRRLSNNEADQP